MYAPEHRALVGVELRVAAGRRLEGHAAVFNSPAIIGTFTEVIRAGAFSASLASGADVVALIDHDAKQLLARTSSGTLKLSEDTRGLAFEIAVPDTTLGRDILTMVERRDVGGMSFGFHVTKEAWPATERRELLAVQLIEISVAQAWPAYQSTSIEARSRGPSGPSLRRRLLDLT